MAFWEPVFDFLIRHGISWAMAGVFTAVGILVGSMMSKWIVGRDFKGKLEAQGKRIETQGKKIETQEKELEQGRLQHRVLGKELQEERGQRRVLEKELQEERVQRRVWESVLESRLSAQDAEIRISRTPSPDTKEGANPSGGDSPADLKKIWEASPGAGRTAAKLIMMVPRLEEARRIYDAFRAASQREDAAPANWAFLRQLDKSGREQEVYDLAFDLTGKEEDINVDGETAEELIRLRR